VTETGETRAALPNQEHSRSSAVVKMLLDAWAAAIGQPAFVLSTFAELTGAPPRTFLEWATEHAAEFRM
jgi:hypothetical protein